MQIDWRKMLIEALPAVAMTTGGVYVYRKKGSVPLAALGALGAYGLYIMGRKAVRWFLEGTQALPTKTAELPKVEQSPVVQGAPGQPSITSPSGVQMAGTVTMPDGSTRPATVSVLDDAEDGTPRGGQILPFAQRG